MALFDNINSRYTQSMAEGGSYRRDAAEGGYDRKELRGLSKQAKSGSLTQRERARYKYLKDERKGRRKRGLLAGLGGAAALAGGLAAAGKLGGGSGGGGLMDSIKNKLQDRTKRKAEEEQFNRREANLQQELRDDNLASAIEGSEDKEVSTDIYGKKFQDTLSDISLEEELTQDEGASSNMQEPSDMELYDEYGKSFDGLEGELRARNKASQVVQGSKYLTSPTNDVPFDMYYNWNPETGEDDSKGTKLSWGAEERLAPGGTRENRADLEDLKYKTAFNSLRPQLGADAAYDAASSYSYGDDEGYLRPFEAEKISDTPAEGRPLTEAESLRSRMARRPGQPYDRSELPDPEYRVGPPVRTGGPRAKFGMKVGTPKQQKIDRLRKFMKNRYR